MAFTPVTENGLTTCENFIEWIVMSLFQCENCGCAENTALSNNGYTYVESYDWSFAPELKGKKLCSACGPSKYSDGRDTEDRGWHGEFSRKFLPIDMFFTNSDGNLEHKETGSTDFSQYEIKD